MQMFAGKKLWAAGVLKATEMNVGGSVGKWNPVSIVASGLRKGMCITCAVLCVVDSVPYLAANGQAANVVK